MLTGGLTYHFGQPNPLRLGPGPLQIQQQKNGRVRHGDQMTVEWGLSKGLGPVSLGLVGYSRWQTSGDNGPGAGNDKAARHAVGAKVVYPHPERGRVPQGAYYKEVNVKAAVAAQGLQRARWCASPW